MRIRAQTRPEIPRDEFDHLPRARGLLTAQDGLKTSKIPPASNA